MLEQSNLGLHFFNEAPKTLEQIFVMISTLRVNELFDTT